MRAMPGPRGPISELLFERWQCKPHRIGTPEQGCESSTPLFDEDLQLALYCCYELHYGGLPGVDERWEWDPSLLELRADLEASFEGALLDEVGAPSESAEPQEMDLALRAIAAADDGPSLAAFVERRADLDQVVEFLVHRSAYQLKEADPHSWALPRLTGPAKAALVEIQADEYGGGRPERIHADDVRAHHGGPGPRLGVRGLSRCHPGDHAGHGQPDVDARPAPSLARRHRGSPGTVRDDLLDPNRRYATGLRRLGQGEHATAFFDEHVEADAVHENIAAVDLAGGLVRQDPGLGPAVLWGARALAALDAKWARQVLDAWELGRSSLRTPLPQLAA